MMRAHGVGSRAFCILLYDDAATGSALPELQV